MMVVIPDVLGGGGGVEATDPQNYEITIAQEIFSYFQIRTTKMVP